MMRVRPDGVGPGWEECHVSRAKPTLHALSVGHEPFARQNNVSLILAVVPFIADRPALPHYDVREPISGRA